MDDNTAVMDKPTTARHEGVKALAKTFQLIDGKPLDPSLPSLPSLRDRFYHAYERLHTHNISMGVIRHRLFTEGEMPPTEGNPHMDDKNIGFVPFMNFFMGEIEMLLSSIEAHTNAIMKQV